MVRMRRARSSVGTCACSKLLSRHKLLVSDQLSLLRICLGAGLLLFYVSIGPTCVFFGRFRIWLLRVFLKPLEVIRWFFYACSVVQLLLVSGRFVFGFLVVI